MRRALLMVIAFASAAATASAAGPATAPATRAEAFRAYETALANRRLGSNAAMSLEDVRTRLADAEDLVRSGRLDEAIARLTDLVESPPFDPFAENDEGRAAV